MLEVITRFPAIGTIANYKALPEGERILYDQFALIKFQEETQLAVGKIGKQLLS